MQNLHGFAEALLPDSSLCDILSSGQTSEVCQATCSDTPCGCQTHHKNPSGLTTRYRRLFCHHIASRRTNQAYHSESAPSASSVRSGTNQERSSHVELLHPQDERQHR